MNAINLWHLTRPSKMYLCDVWRERHPNMHLLEDPTLWEDNHERLVGKIFSEEIEKGNSAIKAKIAKEYFKFSLYIKLVLLCR